MAPLLVSRMIALWIFCIGTGIGYMMPTTYRIGPSPHFIILGITIDTVPKYIGLCAYVIGNMIMRNLNFNVITPWLIQHVQNTNPLSTPSQHVYQIALCCTMYGWVDSVIYIHVILSQLDIVVLEMVTDLIVNLYLTRAYLVAKKIETA